jgi:ribosomal protein S18 acetylase RimI-like enzyme
MELVPYQTVPGAAEAVVSWAQSAEEAVMWCGARDFPVPAGQIDQWQQSDEVRAYLLIDDAGPAGYGELWLDTEENEVELARIIVAPGRRGRGLGRALALGLLAEATAVGYRDVFLRVHPDNAPALRCYRAAGFTPVAAELAAEWNLPQPVDYLWLEQPTG